ncbi:MAG TPA: aspartate aminotransferase family protein [Roseiarcus sp.]|nr:aspartate aminotransferase family protein [Roseiarcus sp.]
MAESRVLHRSLRGDLPIAARGEGVRLYDTRGREYLDACGGAAVSCLGHSHPAPIAAIKEQAETLAYAHSAFFTSEPAERLAAELLKRAPKSFAKGRAMVLNSGSEANEAALKLARQYHLEQGQSSRGKFIARESAYHGATIGALSAGGHRARRATYAPMLIDVGRIPACYAYRGRKEGESEEAYGQRVADALEREILRIGPENVAAFIAEPVSGATLGAVPPVKDYFRRIREICDKYGALLIADEVMCGAGRTGTFLALEQEGVAADIVVIAKGLGAGLQPIAAILASERVVKAIENGSGALAHGQTYMAHPMVCAAALAVLETIERDKLLDNVRARGEQLGALLGARLGRRPHVGDIRGRGLFRGVEFVRDRESKTPFPTQAKLAQRLKASAMARGLMVYPASGCVDGISGDHVLLAPPYIVEPSDVELIVERFALAVDDALAGVRADF